MFAKPARFVQPRTLANPKLALFVLLQLRGRSEEAGHMVLAVEHLAEPAQKSQELNRSVLAQEPQLAPGR